MAGNFRHFHTVNNAAWERETCRKRGGTVAGRKAAIEWGRHRWERSNGMNEWWKNHAWNEGSTGWDTRRQRWILWRQMHWLRHYMVAPVVVSDPHLTECKREQCAWEINLFSCRAWKDAWNYAQPAARLTLPTHYIAELAFFVSTLAVKVTMTAGRRCSPAITILRIHMHVHVQCSSPRLHVLSSRRSSV